MKTKPGDGPLLQKQPHVPEVTLESAVPAQAGPVATRDHRLIRQWADEHQAEPATGEATTSGPATTDIRDGGAGIRFNFPAVTRLRQITWEEWFDNFERHELTFVYEAQADTNSPPSPRYRIVKTADWSEQIG